MIKFIKSHFVTILLFVVVICLSSLYPDINISISGGWAWIFIVYMSFVIIAGVIISIIGGTLSYEAEGLIPRIKRWIKKEN